MDDNATCHRTLAVQDYLDSEGIQHLVWPACSPDLNPIENVWDALGRKVADRNYPPTNKNTLIRALTEEWDKLPQQLLDNVVQSDPDCGFAFVTGSSPVPPKTRRVGQRCTLNLSRAETSSRWCGVVVRRGCQLRCRPRHFDHGSKLRGPSPKALV
ncbi:transposable element Tc1 transposase [Trichonephila clavipes]|nr:transposable element Tc1 transposase [Trichonephila clavipes]